MKINQLKAGVILSYMTQAVHILSGIVYTPIMLRLLGQSEYGLYQLVSSVVSYLSLFSLGFGSGYIRFYSKYKSQKDWDSIAKLNGMFFIIFAILATASIVCGGIMVSCANYVFGNGLTPEELSKARILMSLLIVSMALSLLGTIFSNVITANEEFFFQRMINFLKNLLSPFITLPLLLMGFGSVGMVCVSVGLTVIAFCINILFCIKKLKIQFSFKNLNFLLLKEIWIFTFFIFINTIVDQINWNVDKFLLGRMIGTTAVATYGVAASLNSMYISFATAISSVFVPRVNRIIAENKNNSILTELFIKVGRIQFVLVGLIISGYVLFGKEFIKIWAGKGYEQSYYIGIFLLIPVTIPLIQNLGIEIQRAKNMHKVRSVVYLIMAIANIFISYLLIKQWGVIGAAIGTAISMIACNGIFMNIYYHKKIGLDIKAFWKEIFKFTPIIFFSVIMGVALKFLLPQNNFLWLFFTIIIYTALYGALMLLWGMNDSEKMLIINPMKKVVKKLWKK